MISQKPFPKFLNEWRKVNGKDFTPLMYLNFPGNFKSAAVARWLYVPDFVEYRGGVFTSGIPEGLTEGKKESLDRGFLDFGGSIPHVEQLGNLIEFWDLFDDRDIEDSHDEIVQIGIAVRDSWEALLRLRYPARNFHVYFLDDRNSGPQVSFYSLPADLQ